MLTSFKNLKKFQLSEYILLALFAFSIPFSWRIATYVMMVLFANVILRGVFEEGFKPNQLQQKHKFVYLIFIAFWAIYAISFLYSENSAEARVQIGKKLSFLLFPLYFLFSNLSYLTKERVRTIMYCFVFGILALYIVNLVWAGYDVVFEEAKKTRFFEPDFLKLGTGYIHHSYISIYTCISVAFCFAEAFTNRRTIYFNVLSIIVLILFTIISKSRAGLLCMAMTFFILWIWLTFVQKKKVLGLSVGVIMISVVVLTFVFFQNSVKRITETLSNLQNIEKQDRRIGITIGYKNLLIDKFWFGVGAGDRGDETLKSYIKKMEEIVQRIKPRDNYYSDTFVQEREDCLESIRKKYGGTLNNNTFKYAKEMSEKYNCDYNSVRENLATYINVNVAINSECNAHNQFSDTIIAVGLIGLLLFISMFLSPIYLWIKNKNFDIVFFSLLIIIAFNSLFESVLERQMGIMFFVFFYMLLFHGVFCQQTTDNEQQT
ncbi:MAG: O-antigen ligase family protein [Bacteroidales bacterium]|nr:O-antigen ligase family protein [Bacteroidales bacterium]